MHRSLSNKSTGDEKMSKRIKPYSAGVDVRVKLDLRSYNLLLLAIASQIAVLLMIKNPVAGLTLLSIIVGAGIHDV